MAAEVIVGIAVASAAAADERLGRRVGAVLIHSAGIIAVGAERLNAFNRAYAGLSQRRTCSTI